MVEILSGIKVLDLTRVIAGPYCTQLLADMGATVYKIERPGAGDDSRLIRPFMKNEKGEDTADSAFFLSANRGKQSVTVDVAVPEGAALVRELAAGCDVMIENYKTGGLKKYGLDYDSIRKINPDIVYCSVTGFGQTGPYAKRPAYDSIMQATAGLMSMAGDADGEPMRSTLPICDMTTGYCAAVAILAALYHRKNGGKGQYIDTAMLDASITLNAQHAISYLVMGEVPKRTGNLSPNVYPSGVFPTADSHLIMVCTTNPQFDRLCTVIGRPDLAGDPRFASNVLRRQNRPALAVELTRALTTRTAAEWSEAFEEAGIPSSAINHMDEVFADPQVVARGLRVKLPHASGKTISVVRSPLRFSQTPVSHRPPPQLGEHTDDVLGGVLGKSREELARLRAAGAI
jgi:crotonobetainyl-CoA:carnitine CoA-transferase CaiB-like acyl-CoA transferase